MRIRLCDKCGKQIKGKFIKCCESSIENKKQILKHIGDLCMECWSPKSLPPIRPAPINKMRFHK